MLTVFSPSSPFGQHQPYHTDCTSGTVHSHGRDSLAYQRNVRVAHIQYIKKIIYFLMQVALTIEPEFVWKEKIHGSSERWWIWVEVRKLFYLNQSPLRALDKMFLYFCLFITQLVDFPDELRWWMSNRILIMSIFIIQSSLS